jgi:photosystem II stability/assembly factor-like uncharacterized protein
MKLAVGGTHRFVVYARDLSGHPVEAVQADWSVSDSTVATVVAGQVTASAEGAAVVTASYQGLRTTALIEVVPAPVSAPRIASIEVTPAVDRLAAGAKQPLETVARDRSGVKIDLEKSAFSWRSSNPKIATVDPAGLVTALQPGEAEITVAAGQVTQMFPMVVYDPQAPIARISVSTRQGEAPLTVRFSGAGSTDDVRIRAYEWSFGEGNFGTGATVDHSYRSGGRWPITLKVIDNSGREGFAKTTIDVRNTLSPEICTPPPTNGWETVHDQEGLQDLWGVHFINECEGWTVGREMALAHTTDGGATWQRQTDLRWKENKAPQILPDLYDVFFLDAKTGWAAGWPEIILATTDGGATWREQRRNAAYTDDLCLGADPLGNCARKNWCDHPDPALPGKCLGKKSGPSLQRIRFADPKNGWAVGRAGTLLQTVDGGATWTDPPQKPQNPVPCLDGAGAQRVDYTPHWYGLDLPSSREVWIAGGEDDGTGCAGWNRVIIHTTDGGVTWVYQNDHPGFGALGGSGRYHDLRLTGPLGWAVGEAGTILRTIDRGFTWERISGTGAGGATLWGVSFVDSFDLWITGADGVILHTGNADAPARSEILWTEQRSGTGTELRRSSFVNLNTGWIAGPFRLLRTTTGGEPLPAAGG